LPGSWRKDPKDGARHIIDELKLADQVAFGKTKLFIKEPMTLVQLEDAREKMIPVLATKIQACVPVVPLPPLSSRNRRRLLPCFNHHHSIGALEDDAGWPCCPRRLLRYLVLP